MSRECKGFCKIHYPNALWRKVQYWDYLGFKLCNICKFLVKIDECKDNKCKCCITKFRLKVRNPQNRQTRDILNRKPRTVNYFIDYTKIECFICNSKETYFNKKKNRPIWHKYNNDNYYCQKCRHRITYKKKKKELIEQNLIVVKYNTKHFLTKT